jgi:hypothetical protein
MDNTKYFLYSEEQINEKNEILGKTSRKFSPGIVVVNNKKEQFTILSTKPDMSRFSDTRIVAMGDPKTFTYKMPEIVSVRG